MKQRFLKENRWCGGIFLDDDIFRNIVQPSFCRIPSGKTDKLYLPMKIKDDEACQVNVSVGEYVNKYDIIGIREGKKLQDFHVVRTDLPGYVEAIDRKQTGYRTFEEYVELKICAEGESRKDESNEGRGQISDLAKTREILAGSGIPEINRILFEGGVQRKCEVIILNAVMDDPSLFYNILMMKEHPGQLLYGLLIFLRVLEAGEIFIVVGERQQDSVKYVMRAADRFFVPEMREKISFIYVPDTYPGGRDEFVLQNLAEWVTGRSRVMLHADQVLGAYDMIYDHKPWTRRRFLLGGCTDMNGCYELPIGASLKETVYHPYEKWLRVSGVLIDGGLMAGYAINPECAVARSDMQSVLILPRMEENEQTCLACMKCEQICPSGILPWKDQHDKDWQRCLGCGSCSYVCPSRRRLREYVQRGGRPGNSAGRGSYIDLPEKGCQLMSSVVTGYSSPYIRQAQSPFTCILSPFKL